MICDRGDERPLGIRPKVSRFSYRKTLWSTRVFIRTLRTVIIKKFFFQKSRWGQTRKGFIVKPYYWSRRRVDFPKRRWGGPCTFHGLQVEVTHYVHPWLEKCIKNVNHTSHTVWIRTHTHAHTSMTPLVDHTVLQPPESFEPVLTVNRGTFE